MEVVEKLKDLVPMISTNGSIRGVPVNYSGDGTIRRSLERSWRGGWYLENKSSVVGESGHTNSNLWHYVLRREGNWGVWNEKIYML